MRLRSCGPAEVCRASAFVLAHLTKVTTTSFTAGAAFDTAVDSVTLYCAYRLVPPTTAPDERARNAVQFVPSGVGVVPVRTSTTTLGPAGKSETPEEVCASA